MNTWRRGSLTDNPYYRTAFHIARVSREVLRRQAIVQTIRQTRQILRVAPQTHAVAGQPVTEAMLHTAEEVLLTPEKRIAEELLEHATEPPRLESIRKVADELAQAMAADETSPLPGTNLAALRSWAGELVGTFLAHHPGPDPSFGARELEIIPPFGRMERGSC